MNISISVQFPALTIPILLRDVNDFDYINTEQKSIKRIIVLILYYNSSVHCNAVVFVIISTAYDLMFFFQPKHVRLVFYQNLRSLYPLVEHYWICIFVVYARIAPF